MGNHNWDFNVTEKDKIYIENKEEYLSEKEARDKRLEIYTQKIQEKVSNKSRESRS